MFWSVKLIHSKFTDSIFSTLVLGGQKTPRKLKTFTKHTTKSATYIQQKTSVVPSPGDESKSSTEGLPGRREEEAVLAINSLQEEPSQRGLWHEDYFNNNKYLQKLFEFLI